MKRNSNANWDMGGFVMLMIVGGFFLCGFLFGLQLTRKGSWMIRKILLYTALTAALTGLAYFILSFFVYTNYTHDLLAAEAFIVIQQCAGFFLGGMTRLAVNRNKVKPQDNIPK